MPRWQVLYVSFLISATSWVSSHVVGQTDRKEAASLRMHQFQSKPWCWTSLQTKSKSFKWLSTAAITRQTNDRDWAWPVSISYGCWLSGHSHRPRRSWRSDGISHDRGGKHWTASHQNCFRWHWCSCHTGPTICTQEQTGCITMLSSLRIHVLQVYLWTTSMKSSNHTGTSCLPFFLPMHLPDVIRFLHCLGLEGQLFWKSCCLSMVWWSLQLYRHRRKRWHILVFSSKPWCATRNKDQACRATWEFQKKDCWKATCCTQTLKSTTMTTFAPAPSRHWHALHSASAKEVSSARIPGQFPSRRPRGNAHLLHYLFSFTVTVSFSCFHFIFYKTRRVANYTWHQLPSDSDGQFSRQCNKFVRLVSGIFRNKTPKCYRVWWAGAALGRSPLCISRSWNIDLGHHSRIHLTVFSSLVVAVLFNFYGKGFYYCYFLYFFLQAFQFYSSKLMLEHT